jgi:ArsR family transcriptional regulator
MKHLIRLLKALSDPNRVKIIKMLQKRHMCVCELQAALGIAQPTVSNHLKALVDAGLIASAKEGQWVNYSIATGETKYAQTLLRHLKEWLEDDPDVAQLLGSLNSIRRENLCSTKMGKKPHSRGQI